MNATQESSPEEILKATLRDFLEKEPLYHPVRIPAGFKNSYYWPANISYWCRTDKSEKTFKNFNTRQVKAVAQEHTYTCTDCGREEMDIFTVGYIRGDASQGWVEKIGQYPPYRIEPSRNMKRFLKRDDEDLYKKALICLSQSYGLGALAYLRRVVENQAREFLLLLAEIRQQEGASDDDLKKLRELAESKDVESMLKKALEIYPNYLRPGGENPMAVIYGVARGGIHRGSEEGCVNKAKEIRTALEYAVPAIARQVKDKRDYLDAMKGLRTPPPQLSETY